MPERSAEAVVDIWSFHEDEACPIDVARRHVSDGEWLRAQRFRAAPDRAAFARGRATIRRILAGYLDQPPSEIRLGTGRYGKPDLAADVGLHVNWSHSRGQWLMAVTSAGPVGADIECVLPDLDWHGPAAIAFHPDERHFVTRQASGRVERFCKLWVCKEAAFKAAGYGLHDDMARVTMVDPKGAIAVPVAMLDGTRWHVHDVPAPAAPFAAAIAVGSPKVRLRFCDLAQLPVRSEEDRGRHLPTTPPRAVTGKVC
ncbi:MAG TPA: 4'-phosphopantetheinyl transferase superfamily protein [Rhodopila sp.]